MPVQPPYRRGARRWLLLGFIGVAVIFVAQAAIGFSWTSASGRSARRLYEDALTSIEVVSRISRDLDRERILLDDHVFVTDPAKVAALEAELSRTAADLSRSEAMFAPLATEPEESALWQRVQQPLERFEHAAAEALELSHNDRDAEAREKMLSVMDEYTELNDELTALIQLHRDEAVQAMAKVRALQQSTQVVLWTTGLAGFLAVIVLAWFGLSRFTAYERRLVGYSRLLEERNRELDAFAGRVAHDLRSPLGSISLTTEALARNASGEQVANLDRLRRGAKRIEATIEDLLALSRLEAPSEGELCNPAVVAANVREDFAERFGDEALLRLDLEAASVRGVEGLCRQALWNLVENGVKYRREAVKPEIALTGRAGPAGYELQVADNGMGMSPEEVKRIFEPFFRARRGSEVGGIGLGLTIVKHIVEAKGGSISVVSQLGQGTTFSLRLPLADARARK